MALPNPPQDVFVYGITDDAASVRWEEPSEAPTFMPYSDIVLGLSPSLYLRLGDGIGSSQLTDSSGNGRHFPTSSLPTGLASPGLLSGEVDDAVFFDGTGQAQLMGWTQTQITLAAIVSPTNSGTLRTIFAQAEEAYSDRRVCKLMINEDDHMVFQGWNDSSVMSEVIGTTELIDNARYLVAGIYESTGLMTLYTYELTNGSAPLGGLDGSNLTSNGPLRSAGSITLCFLGASYDSSFYGHYRGTMDELFMVDGVVDESDLLLLAESASGFGSILPGNVESYEYSLDSATPVDVGLSLEVSFSDLIPETTYRIDVRSKNLDGFSDWIGIDFTTESIRPDPPQNLSASLVDETYAEIVWDPPVTGNPSTGYEYSLNFGPYVLVTSDDVTVNDLQNGSVYNFRVRTVDGVSYSDWAEITFKTLGAPDPVTGLAYDNLSYDSVHLYWDEAEGTPALGYEYMLNDQAIVSIGNFTEVDILGLSPNTIYEFKVRGYNNYDGESEWRSIVFQTTAGPPLPPSVEIVEVGYDHASLKWVESNLGAPTLSYAYYFNDTSLVVATSSRTVDLENLNRGTTYSFGVRSVNSEGHSNWTVVNFTTTIGPPPPPDELKVSQQTQTEAFVSWKAPTVGPQVNRFEYSIDYGPEISIDLGTYIILEGMDPGSNHSFRIRSVGDFGESDWVEKKFKTLDPEEVVEKSPKIRWNERSSKFFETGLDRGVLYLDTSYGVPWNGLTGLDDQLGEETSEAFYVDGVKVLDSIVMGNYEASLKAVTYPDEFLDYEGYSDLGSGIYADDQRLRTFGLSYRTLIGNDTSGIDRGYKLHILYNLMAVPNENANETLSDSPNVAEFQWDISSVPVGIPGFRPTAHFILDSRHMDDFILEEIETILYGSEYGEARLPDISEIYEMVTDWRLIRITDHGDGTWSAKGPSSLIKKFEDESFQIKEADAFYISEDTYIIETTGE